MLSITTVFVLKTQYGAIKTSNPLETTHSQLNSFFSDIFFSIESNKAMSEICETGKCHQNAAQQSVLRAKEMFDTLRKNDMCEENEAIQKKLVNK